MNHHDQAFAKITAPGHYAMSHEQYHNDPAPMMSLSSTGAKQLVSVCPAQFIHDRSERVYKRAFDIGNAGHLMVLEPSLFSERVAIVQGVTKDGRPSEGYTTADARKQRDDAYAAGKVPLLQSEADMIWQMRTALWSHPIAGKAFVEGLPEQSLFWKDREFGIWCRSRPDWMPTQPRYLLNYKTAVSAKPSDIQKQIWDMGYFQSSAWEMDAFEAIFGQRPQQYGLVVQAKKAPYLTTVVWLDPDDLADGAKLNRRARGIFAECQQSGVWPDYQGGKIPTLGVPGWARKRLDEMAEAGEMDPPQDRVMEQVAA